MTSNGIYYDPERRAWFVKCGHGEYEIRYIDRNERPVKDGE